MTIWPLIDAGEFSAISNGQVTAEDLALADGKWSNFVERKVNELPDGLRTLARYGLITRDTALFQGLARSVQYGDFVAKAILYDHETKRNKLSKVEAIAAVASIDSTVWFDSIQLLPSVMAATPRVKIPSDMPR